MLNNGRATITQSYNSLYISVPSKKNWVALIFAFFWLFGWGWGLISVCKQLMTGNGLSGPNAFLLFWLAAWIVGGLAVITILLWGFFGKEVFHLENGEITFTKSILGVGRKRVLQVHEVRNFRMETGNGDWLGRNRWSFWGLGPGKIKFDYGMKTFSFGLGLDDAEANHIVKLLNEHFNKTHV